MQELITFLSNHQGLTLAAAIILVLLLIIEVMRMQRNTIGLAPQQAIQKINRDNAVVVDIRSADAFKNGHIIDAQNWSTEDLKNNQKKLEKFKTKPMIIVCANGMESQKIAALLIKQGYNAFALSGGIRAWIDAPLPIVKE